MQEKTLYQVWENLKTPHVLYTINHEPVVIHHTGRKNQSGGPDYLDVLLEINGIFVRGPVEIHSRASDWFHHQHYLDRHYQQVLLHVVWHCDLNEDELKRLPCPTVILSLNISAELKAGKNNISAHALKSLAKQRLKNLQGIYSQLLQKFSFEYLLLESIFKACGYPYNQRSFSKVFQYWYHLNEEQKNQLLSLIHPIGALFFLLFPGYHTLSFEERKKVLKYFSQDYTYKVISFFTFPSPPEITFQLGGIHPSNRPAKKIELLYYFLRKNFLHRTLQSIQELIMLRLPPDALPHKLLALFSVSIQHPLIAPYSLNKVLSKPRIIEWLVTDAIPLYMAHFSSPLFKEYLEYLYFHLPRGYSYTRNNNHFSYAWQYQAVKAHQYKSTTFLNQILLQSY